MLRDLERTKQRYIADDLEIYFDDINDASERIWDMLENYKEVVEALEDTNESVISHRVNEVLKVLTAFSVVILPLTLLASLFGMNVEFPFHTGVGAFWAIVRSCADRWCCSRGMVAYFRARGRLRALLLERRLVVDPSIFKAYDVRGTYPDQMDEDVAYRIGRAFARVLGELEGKPVSDLRVAIGARHAAVRAGHGRPLRRGARATRAWTCSTSGWRAPRWSTGPSARATWTAA